MDASWWGRGWLQMTLDLRRAWPIFCFGVGGRQGYTSIWNTVLFQKLSTKVLGPSCRVINISQHTRFPSKGKVEGHEPLHNVDHYIVGPSMEPFGTTNMEPNGTKFLKDLIGSKDMIPNRKQRWQTFGTTKWPQMEPKGGSAKKMTLAGLFH